MKARKQIKAIAERMLAVCTTLREYTPKSQQHVSLEIVEKWARELEQAIKGEEG
jgi:hypothetical protein